MFTAEVGAVEKPAESSCVREVCSDGELSEAEEFKEMQEMEPLPLPLYVRVREEPRRDNDGLEEIRWRPAKSRARPLSFTG